MNGSPAEPKAFVAMSSMPAPTSGTPVNASPSVTPAPWMLWPPVWSTRPASANDEITPWTLAPTTTHSETQAQVATSATISRRRAAGSSLQNFSIVVSSRGLHPEDAESRFGDRCVEGGFEPEGQDAPGIERVDDPVVPEAGGREVRRTFPLVGFEDRRLEGVALRVVGELATDRGQDAGGL